MTHDLTRPAAATATPVLLAAGVAAGPLFIAVAGAQVLTRDGFDLGSQPISELSRGDLGWIQVANFIVSGLLTVAFAAGMRRVLHPGRAGTFGPLLVGLYGAGLTCAGVFVVGDADPGTPMSDYTWNTLAHSLATSLSFLSATLACFVLARRSAAAGEHGWFAYCLLTGVAALLLGMWPSTAGASVRFAVGALLTATWVTLLALRLRRGHLEGADQRVPVA